MKKSKLKKQLKKTQSQLKKLSAKPKSTSDEVKALTKQMSQLQQKSAKTKAKSKQIKINADRDRLLGEALTKAGASKGASKTVKMLASGKVKTDSGKKPIVNAKKGTFRNANNGKVLTRKNGKDFKAKHYLQHLEKKEGIQIFKGAKGSGSKGGSKGSSKSFDGLYRSEFSTKDQVKFIKKNGSKAFDKLPNSRPSKELN